MTAKRFAGTLGYDVNCTYDDPNPAKYTLVRVDVYGVRRNSEELRETGIGEFTSFVEARTVCNILNKEVSLVLNKTNGFRYLLASTGISRYLHQ